MPNALAHIGAQGLATRLVLPRADAKWLLVGCIIPDIPWIIWRALRTLTPGLDAYDLRLYAIVQSSLAVSLVLCAALAALSTAPRPVFLLLALNALFHLLLDATQIKWGNGVHILAPLSWRLWRLDLFWPDSLPTYLLTGLGVLVSVWILWGKTGSVGLDFRPGRIAVAAVLLAMWLTIPLALDRGAAAADNHFVGTLQARQERPGRPLELDRAPYRPGPVTDSIRTYAGEALAVTGERAARRGLVSVRARFVDQQTIRVHELHRHGGWPRDLFSYLGLALVVAVWAVELRRVARRSPDVGSA